MRFHALNMTLAILQILATNFIVGAQGARVVTGPGHPLEPPLLTGDV